jgi:hypothetical protein
MNNMPDNYFVCVGKSRPEDSEIDKTREMEYSQVLAGERDIAETIASWASASDAIH